MNEETILLFIIIILLFFIYFSRIVRSAPIIDNFQDDSIVNFRKCFRDFPDCTGKLGYDWAWQGAQCPGYNWSNKNIWMRKLCKPVDCSIKNYAFTCQNDS